jgi:stage V sporulation protein S
MAYINGKRYLNMKIVKVSGTSRTSAVAGAIAGIIREQNEVSVQAIGASAVNQAVKAIIIARKYLQQDSIVVSLNMDFVDVEIDDKTRTAVKFTLERVEQAPPPNITGM